MIPRRGHTVRRLLTTQKDYNMHLLTDLEGVGDIEANAFQRASNAILQKSTGGSFRLTVTGAP
jgi:trehalose synthase